MKNNLMPKEEFNLMRILLGFSRARLAYVLGITPQTVNAWESGKTPVPYYVQPFMKSYYKSAVRHAERLATDVKPSQLILYSDQAAYEQYPPEDGYIPDYVEVYNAHVRMAHMHLTLQGDKVLVVMKGNENENE